MRRPNCSAFLFEKTPERTLNIAFFFIAFMVAAIFHDGSIPNAKRLAWSVGDEKCLVNAETRQRLLFIAAIDWR